MKSLAIIFVVLNLGVRLEAQDFGYSPEDQQHWAQAYPDCGKTDQSPIEIFPNSAEPLVTRNLNLSGYFEKVPLILKNNGHTAEAFIDETQTENYFKMPRLSGGPLIDTYEFQNFHYHWGEQDDRGSEHVIAGSDYPLELHLVHKNKKYDTIDEALQNYDGLAVLGVLFHLSDADGSEILPISESLINIQQYNATTAVNPSYPLRFFFEKLNTGKFFTYHGSLTTPPCSEVVTWIVFRETLAVSTDQLNQFRSLFDEYGNTVVKNYRFLQPLNYRPVFRRISVLPSHV